MNTFSPLIILLLLQVLVSTALLIPFDNAVFASRDRAIISPNAHSIDPRAEGSPGLGCNWTQKFDTLESLDNYLSPPRDHTIVISSRTTPISCSAYYALRTLISLMDQAIANYTSVNDGYDDLFKTYKDYMYESTPGVVEDLMITQKTIVTDTSYSDGPGMKYFDCTINGRSTACPDRKLASISEEATPVILKLRDANGFSAELARKGLSLDWISYGDFSVTDTHVAKGETYHTRKQFQNFPIRNDSMIVPNPKDIVTPALKSVPSLRSDMANIATEIILEQRSEASITDPAQVYSVPIFVLMQGVDNMRQAKETAEKVKAEEEKEAEEQKKNVILMIVSMVLIFVPIVGQELAGAAGLATLARSIMIIGELGNGALAVYDTVQNPNSAIVNLLGMLFGLGGVLRAGRTEKELSDLAAIRATIKPDTIMNFGPLFRDQDSRLQSILACR